MSQLFPLPRYPRKSNLLNSQADHKHPPDFFERFNDSSMIPLDVQQKKYYNQIGKMV